MSIFETLSLVGLSSFGSLAPMDLEGSLALSYLSGDGTVLKIWPLNFDVSFLVK